MKQKRITLLLSTLLFLTYLSVKAQPSNIDKLLADISIYKKNDTNLVKLYLQLAQAYYGNNPVKLLETSQKAFSTAKEINYNKGLGDAARYMGIGYYLQGNFVFAKKQFTISFDVYKSIRNVKGMISALSNLGSVSNVLNNFPEAIEYYRQSVVQAEKINDFLLMGINYGNIGTVYSQIENYEEARKYYQKAITAHKKINYQQGLATSLGNIGNIYFNQNNFSKAKLYYDSALIINKELQLKFEIARELGNIANSNLELNFLKEAETQFQEAIRINTAISNKKGLAVDFQGLANYYFKLSKFNQALTFVHNSLRLAQETNIADVQSSSCKLLSEVFEFLGNYDSAYYYFKLHINIKNKIDNESTRKKIVHLGLKYEFDVKEQKYLSLQTLNTAVITQQKLQLALNQARLKESNQYRDIQRLQILKTNAELSNQTLLNRSKENEVLLLKKEKNIETEKKNLAKLKLRQTWLIVISAFAILILIAFSIINSLRTKSLKAKGELALQKINQLNSELRLQNDLKEAEMATLRSQMNPHFIFNALGAINHFVLTNQAETASEYISIFSKLMRNVLQNSQYSSISLANELDILHWYLQLEQARLNFSLNFEIYCDPDIDKNYIKIPPLILQPFVENAVWHGLRNKTESGEITITITKYGEYGLLIAVQDNGIGRSAAATVDQAKKDHKSKGIQITIDRITALDENNKVEYIDLIDSNGNAAGTLVNVYLFNT